MSNTDALANAINKAINLTSNEPASMGITKIPEIQSRTVKEQTFLEYLEMQNRTRDISTNNVVFYEESGGTDAAFTDEVTVPEYTATTFTEVTDSTKTVAIPIKISFKAQEGTDVVDLKQRFINDGYVKVNNLIDQALLAGDTTQDQYSFNKIWKDCESTDNSGATITEQVVKETIQACIDEGGSPDCIVTDATVANQLDDLVNPYIRYANVMEMALGHQVSTFKSTDGSFIPILVDKNMPSTTNDHKLLVLDSSTVDVAYQRRPSYIQLAQTNLASNDAIFAWVTAYNTGSFKSQIIEGIGDE